jgi:hypothetical protein
MVFFLVLSPKFVLAERKIQQIGSVKLLIPKDNKVNIFANDVYPAKHIAFDDQSILFLSQTKEGKVIALIDFNKNGEADEKVSIIFNHKAPHGLAFLKHNDNYYLYVAKETKLIRLKRIRIPFMYGTPETIIENIPGGGHYTRTIKI